MITVSIFINGNPVITRSAVNVTERRKSVVSEPNKYEVDDGSIIEHVPKKGAVELAIKMLRKVKLP